MNRRKLLGFLAAAPLAPVAAKAAVALPEVAPVVTPPTQFIPPMGYMMHTVDHTIAPCQPYYANSAMQAVAMVVRKIWDGEKFVNCDSQEGVDVMNKVLKQR